MYDLIINLRCGHLEVRQERVQFRRRRPRVRLEAPDALEDVPAQIAAEPGLALLRVHVQRPILRQAVVI